MCRRNQLFGWILLSFGLGLLIGLCLESCFISSAVGIAITVGGFCFLRQR